MIIWNKLSCYYWIVKEIKRETNEILFMICFLPDLRGCIYHFSISFGFFLTGMVVLLDQSLYFIIMFEILHELIIFIDIFNNLYNTR